MRNRRAFALAVSSSVLFTVAIIACSSDDSGSTFAGPKVDSGPVDSGPAIFNPDADPQQKPDGPVVCPPSLPTTFNPTWVPPVVAHVCTDTALQGYYDSCIANDSAGKSQFDGKTCTDWLTANATCAACVEKTDNSGPIQIFNTPKPRYYFTLNNAGCIAIEQNQLGATSCGALYDAATQCRRDSCNECFNTANAQFSDFIACQSAANSSACTEYDNKSDTACVGYKDAGADSGGVPQCFPLTQSDGTPEKQRDFYLRVESFFCK